MVIFRFYFSYSSVFTSTCRLNSSSCLVATVEGAWVIGSVALLFLGKAITSRIFSSPANSMTKRSKPLKILNTINFKKSMHYNPFAYVHSEKDILKLVTTLMTNTKGEGSGGDPFWEKSERLLLTALIAYLHYEAPVEEQNFATLLEMLNTMQVLEDDEEYQNPVDLLFEELAKKKPNSFAGRQYKLYKLAAGDICSK